MRVRRVDWKLFSFLRQAACSSIVVRRAILAVLHGEVVPMVWQSAPCPVLKPS